MGGYIKIVDRTCALCGALFRGQPKAKYCSTGKGSCHASALRARNTVARQLQLKFPVDQRSPLRIAYEAGDGQRLIEILRSSVVINDQGCWIWQRRLDSDGYPYARIGRREYAAHRLVAMAKGWSIEGAPVHHKCSRSACINPDHLQVVTTIENTAEMMERQQYLARIRELETLVATMQRGA